MVQVQLVKIFDAVLVLGDDKKRKMLGRPRIPLVQNQAYKTVRNFRL
jgi:hypothetical protein